jgi:hypothetical protein
MTSEMPKRSPKRFELRYEGIESAIGVALTAAISSSPARTARRRPCSRSRTDGINSVGGPLMGEAAAPILRPGPVLQGLARYGRNDRTERDRRAAVPYRDGGLR